ncbi:MAG: nucleoside phosphorylase [Bacteroidales bacterium]|jgi:uridine phosphorylase|nr:nucleoside phosphorylase [Bacteroidales bacterium]
MRKIEPSELIINKDGSIFHLHLKPEDIADTILLVGDPGRVDIVASFFDSVEHESRNREFVSKTGYYNNKKFTALSTGIGTDNIDIVINELDALANIDLETRTVKEQHRELSFIRIGTSGAIQGDVEVDSPLISKMAVGFDGLLNFYAGRDEICNNDYEEAFIDHTGWYKKLTSPYFVESDESLINKMSSIGRLGVTISAPGFYGPQGRVLRLPLQDSDLNSKIESFEYNGDKITNFEMECSAIYGLSKLLGHKAATVCAIIANRVNKTYSKDYHPIVKKLIKDVLDSLSA